MTKKSDARRAAEWLKKFDPAEIDEAMQFADGLKEQLREKPQAAAEAAQYFWTPQQRNDLMELRKVWLELSARFDARARAERSPYHKLLFSGSITALEIVSETLMELIDDHLL